MESRVMRFFLMFVLACGVLTSLPSKAALISYNMDWTGNSGFSMTGMFSFDDEDITPGNLITENELNSFMISFFDPSSSPLKSYDLTTVDAGVFNFNFETDTELIRQSGLPDDDFNFTAGGVFPTDVLLVSEHFCPTTGAGLFTSPGFCQTDQLDQGGRINASRRIPTPATLALFGIGLAGLGWTRRKKA
jgi:hypothetical protein